MDLTFQEKSQWLQLGGMTLVFGNYFGRVLPPESDNVLPEHVGLFIGVVVVLVLIQILGHIVLAIFDRSRHDGDERERWIELVAIRNGAYVLAMGVFFSLSIALGTQGNFWFMHVLLGFWVLAQFVEIGSQLYLFRRSA